jgi:hypothetical protein
MTNIFEETYEAMEAARKAYAAATTDEGRKPQRKPTEKPRTGWQRRATSHGRSGELTSIPETTRTRSSNFNDIIWDRDVEALTTCMRENGIKAFTYSCRATDAVETLWLFKQAGCTIGEMVEVNLRKDLWGKGYEKGHAFKMILN